MLIELWSALLADLQALYVAHQAAHWRSKGETFYGDHLLHQRMYENIAKEIDSVAERLLGLTNDDSALDPLKLLSTAAMAAKTVCVPGDACSSMLIAEKTFLKQLSALVDALKMADEISMGSENLLQSIADTHETHVYLLSRRVGTEVLRICVKENIRRPQVASVQLQRAVTLEEKKKKKRKKKQRLAWYIGGGYGINDSGDGSGGDSCG